MEEMLLRQNEKGELEIYKPYASIDVASEEDMKFIEDACKKATPQKPDIEGDSEDSNGNIIYDTWICPSCHTRYEIDYDGHKYCPECGQHIDRTDLD